MRKAFLLTMVLMATAAASAQTVLWNGEDKEVGSDGGFWNRATPTVVEEDGNKCLKITLKENSGGWADEHRMAALPLGEVNLNGLRRISMRIKMSESHNVMIKLTKEGDGGYTGDDTRRWFWYDSNNGWQKLTYEYSVGPNSSNITDTGNTLLEIYPYEFDDKWGAEIFIDDICLEGPVVDGTAVRTLEDGSLTGNITVTGSVQKGSYQNTWDGDWKTESYDDFSLLQSKLAATATSINMNRATVSDGDSPALRNKNANMVIYAPTAFYENDNVVVSGKATSLVLDETYPFDIPEGFDAETVTVKRNLYEGANTFIFPFWVNADEIDGSNGKMATYSKQDNDKVYFTEVTGIGANTPFLMTGIVNTSTELTFTNKGVAATTGESLGTGFVGVYQQTDGNGKWGIGENNTFVKGGSGATVKSFHAYLEATGSNAARLSIVIGDEETTGINAIDNSQWTIDNYYTLSGQCVAQPTKGLYIINNKKVIVK